MDVPQGTLGVGIQGPGVGVGAGDVDIQCRNQSRFAELSQHDAAKLGHIYENNRAEVSHQHTREQERQMRRFKSVAQAQRFLSVHTAVQNLFRVGRHHLKAIHHRMLRDRAFADWRQVTCAC